MTSFSKLIASGMAMSAMWCPGGVYAQNSNSKSAGLTIPAELEVGMPGTHVSGPDYNWKELRKYYMDKLDGFEKRFKE